MRRFFYTLTFSAFCVFPLSEIHAQKKQTIYYPNGKVAFEGRFHMAWNQTERFQNLGTTEEPNLNDNYDREDRENMLNAYRDILPSRVYEGKCRYYYSNGKLFAEGTYKAGFKNGTFKLYHPNGQLGARQSYEWGMAVGHWEIWDDKGQLTGSFHYKAIPENILQEINDKTIRGREEPEMGVKLLFGMEYESFFDQYKKEELFYHSKNLRIFEKYVTKRLYHKAIKEGDFKVWNEGKPYLEMYFSNNVPIANWKIYSNGQPVFEIVFKDGKIIKATDFLQPENNFGSPEYLARKKEESSRSYIETPDAIDPGARGVPGVVPKEEIFRTVQQMPEAGYDFNKYISDHLKIPKGEQTVNGRVVVQFVIRKDGSIDKVESVKSTNVAPAVRAEVIKLVKRMPKWKPGKQNGQAVDVYYTLPVNISSQ